VKKSRFFEFNRDSISKLYKFISALKDHIKSGKQNKEIYINAKDGTFNEDRIFLYVKYSNNYKFTKLEMLLLEKLNIEGFKVYTVVNSDLPKSFEFSLYPSIVRKNVGFDLGAYRDFIQRVGPNCKHLVVINDSLLWNPISFLKIIRKIRNKKGIYFLTNSFQPRLHYQSYFISISGQEAFLEFRNWMEHIKNWKNKFAVVSFGEIRNGKMLSKVSVVYPYEELVMSLINRTKGQSETELARIKFINSQIIAKKFLNPTHYFWKELLEKGFPGIKKDLVFRNPSGIPDLSNEILNKFGFEGITFSNKSSEMRSAKKFITFVRNLISV
jgi:hypothetical protein